MKPKVICWWSGGVTSAVACKLALDLFGTTNCEVVFIDTGNEDDDTYRFRKDCEKWYGVHIGSITGLGEKFNTIQEVWYHYNSLNVASGAICSSELKRDVRKRWQKTVQYDHQVFGFEFTKREFNRAMGMHLNHSRSKPIFPLLMYGYTKERCIEIITEAGIEIPRAYQWGFHNNNCLQTGCVQGGIGYWQKMHSTFPDKFNAMAKVEHDLTDRKGEPVTMCKHQAKGKSGKDARLFLLPHPDYPDNLTVLDIGAKEPQPLFDCNGFDCGVNDLVERSGTEDEINYQFEIDF